MEQRGHITHQPQGIVGKARIRGSRVIVVLLALATLLLPVAVFASDFFIVWPGHPDAPPTAGTRDGIVEREWRVQVDMRGIVANKAAVARITVRLPDGERSFVMRRFSDISGFELVGEDDFQIRPGARDEEISYNWYGEAGTDQMTIAVYQGVMSATITGGADVYTLIRRADSPIFQAIDIARIPPPVELGPAVATQKGWVPTSIPVPQPKSFWDTVDVLVVHTPAALANVGSVADMNARVAESFVQMESALSTSGMDTVRVRNVLSGGNLSIEVPYNEIPGNSCAPGTDANICRWVGHRIWSRTSSTVSALRNTYGADLVVMMVADQAGWLALPTRKTSTVARPRGMRPRPVATSAPRTTRLHSLWSAFRSPLRTRCSRTSWATSSGCSIKAPQGSHPPTTGLTRRLARSSTWKPWWAA